MHTHRKWNILVWLIFEPLKNNLYFKCVKHKIGNDENFKQLLFYLWTSAHVAVSCFKFVSAVLYLGNFKQKHLFPTCRCLFIHTKINTQYEQHLNLNKEWRATAAHANVMLVRFYSRSAVCAGQAKVRESSSQPALLLPLSNELCSIWAFRRVRKVRHYRDRGTRQCYPSQTPTPTAETKRGWDLASRFSSSSPIYFACGVKDGPSGVVTTDVCSCRRASYLFPQVVSLLNF